MGFVIPLLAGMTFGSGYSSKIAQNKQMRRDAPLISVVISAFNEVQTLPTTLCKLQDALKAFTFEVIIVDDGSTDGTTELIRQLNDEGVLVFFHRKKQGKGAALRTALPYLMGQIVVVQDADPGYDPNDIPKLVQPIIGGCADVVFGSRFHSPAQRINLFRHRVAKSWLTWLSNFVKNLNLSDLETGYKAFRKSVLDAVRICEDGFGIEPELTAKVAKLKGRIVEVPISYYGRNFSKGKKTGFRGAIRAAWSVIRYRFAD